MPENFQNFLKYLKQDDTQAWDNLIITTGVIINHWADEKRLEILWCADEKGILSNNKYIRLVIQELRIVLKQEAIEDFSGLKRIILDISNKILTEGFYCFMNLIFDKDKKAWNILSDVVKIKIHRFIRMEGCRQTDSFEEIFQETLIVFSEKLANGSLKFENSYKLKSFLLRIARLKLYEKFRINKRQNESIWIDEMNYHLPDIGSYQEVFEDREYTAYLFKMLEKKERLILYYYFFEQKQLKEIAGKLNIGEENCRIIKYRAIRKLREVVTQNKKMEILN